MSRYKGDNSGGYGNPPVKGQFTKNGKGGPGRPKGSLTIDGALKKVFGGKVPYRENGEHREGPATEALAKRALQHGLSGSQRANAAALELAAKYGPELVEIAAPQYCIENLSPEERGTFLELICKALGEPLPERPKSPFDADYFYFDTTIEGICWKRFNPSLKKPDQLISVGSRAYFSACLPRPNSFHDGRRSNNMGGERNADS